MNYTLDCYATKEMIADFANKTQMSETKIKHLQVAYLYHVKNLMRHWISEITGYALSTLSGMRKKALEWVDEATSFFEKGIDIFNEKIIAPITKREIEFEVPNSSKPCAYVIEHYNATGERLCLKIGKAKDTVKRFRQHLKDQKTYPGLSSIKVKYLFPCENEDDALTMENTLRKFYKSQNNGADYIPQDRFLHQSFSPEQMQDRKIQMQYDLLVE